jgi:DNA-binding transcriptional LysR family regulator
LELRHLRYFAMVAEELHFSRAAQRLHIATPTLSQQIRDLEAELGARLFKRKTKSAVELTHAGRRFLDEALAVLRRARDAEIIGRRAARGEAGVVALAYVLSASCSGLISRAIADFRLSHPEVVIQARAMETLPQFRGILGEAIDVGIMRAPRRYPSNLAGFVIERQPFYIALPIGHRLINQKKLTPEALEGEPLIAAPLEMEPGFWGNIAAVAPSGMALNIVERAPDVLTVLALVAAGAGISVITSGLTRLAIPGVVYKELSFTPRQADHVVAFRKSETSPVVNAFIRGLRRQRSA